MYCKTDGVLLLGKPEDMVTKKFECNFNNDYITFLKINTNLQHLWRPELIRPYIIWLS